MSIKDIDGEVSEGYLVHYKVERNVNDDDIKILEATSIGQLKGENM